MIADGSLVLVIEDDMQIRKHLQTILVSHDYKVVEAETAKEGLLQLSTRIPDLIILDLGLPDRDGVEVIHEIRSWSKIPIIVLSARELEDDKVRALDAGADDYLSKPFGSNELLARMRVSMRRSIDRQSLNEEPALHIRELIIDRVARQATLRGESLHLTPTEYRLLTYLASNAGKVVTHRQLLCEVWGPSYEDEMQYLRGYMAQLRRKIESDTAKPEYFFTEPGVGYRMVARGD